MKPEYMRVRVPVWAVATAAAVLLLGVFIALRILLGGSSEAAAQKLLQLHPDGRGAARPHASTSRSSPIPSPRPIRPSCSASAPELKDDIAAKRLAVEGIKNNIVVRLLNDVAFDPGRAEIRPSSTPSSSALPPPSTASRRTFRIIGHTDATPLKSRLRFKDNQDLSEQRAKAVAQLMAPKLAEPERLETLGPRPRPADRLQQGRGGPRRQPPRRNSDSGSMMASRPAEDRTDEKLAGPGCLDCGHSSRSRPDLVGFPDHDFGDVPPFTSLWLRLALIVFVLALFFGYHAWQFHKRRKASAAIAASSPKRVSKEPNSDARQLSPSGWRDALQTLRKSNKSRGDFLYELPWYIIIGPPGAGKTTALLNSGLEISARLSGRARNPWPAPAAPATATGGSPRTRC